MKKTIALLALILSLLSCKKNQDNNPVNIDPGEWQVACGSDFSFILKPDHSLWATGSNTNGQFGNGTKTSSNTFMKVMDKVKSVVAAQGYSMIIKTDNSLWTTGINRNGQMGTGNLSQTSTPVKIMDDVKDVSVSWSGSTLILKNDGTVWGCGLNNFGQLGNPVVANTPVKITEGFKAVSVSETHALLLDNNDFVWGMGSNFSFQMGEDTTQDGIDYSHGPERIQSEIKVAGITAGYSRSYLLGNVGPVLGAGTNENWVMGILDTNIYAGGDAVRDFSSVLYTGPNSGSGFKSTVYPSPGTNVTYLLEGTNLYACGSSDDMGFGNNNPFAVYKIPHLIMENVKSMSINGHDHHLLLVKTDNSIWGFGSNSSGELGDGTNNDVVAFEKINILQ